MLDYRNLNVCLSRARHFEDVRERRNNGFNMTMSTTATTNDDDDDSDNDNGSDKTRCTNIPYPTIFPGQLLHMVTGVSLLVSSGRTVDITKHFSSLD